ncbi:hypothetical protein PG993_013788 [Apiospora rasikravindrae]|uniref:Ecp2 effector protein-like domain-containing protein n=1 Tax=Apiospora rasikravindrae TaxID=990691 RepID=A0ABR1RRF4_9PEZI
MMDSYLLAGLLAFLPSQALALPAATLTSTAAKTVASFEPVPYHDDLCEEVSYTDQTTADSALTSDCQALKTWANDNKGFFILDNPSDDYTWTLQTINTCTVTVKYVTPPDASAAVYIGNEDLYQILDHALNGTTSATVGYTGTWSCGDEEYPATPEWWIKKTDASSSATSAKAVRQWASPHPDTKDEDVCDCILAGTCERREDAVRATTPSNSGRAASSFFSSALSTARDLLRPTQKQQECAAPEIPFVPGNASTTVCGTSSFTDLTTNDSPHWYDCEPMYEFSGKYGEWLLSNGSDSGEWWRLSMPGVAELDKCEFVVRNKEGRPPVGNGDLDTILRYIQCEKDRAKGQTAEYKGSINCGAEQTPVEWWMRKTQH